MRTHSTLRSHADTIRRDLHEACERLDQHQQRLRDLLDAIGHTDIYTDDANQEEDAECV